MVARHDAAQASLMAQLKARRVKKTYLALVQGSVVGRGRAASRRRSGATRSTGRGWRSSPTAGRRSTGYRVRERFADWTLLELDLVTGRTHQIRVHLEAIGHPVAGDPVYGTGTSRRGPDGLRPAVPARLAARARRRRRTATSSGRPRRCPPSSSRSSTRLREVGPVTDDAVEPEAGDDRRGACDGRDARDHLGAERGRQGHHHRRAPAACRTTRTTTTS